MENKMIPQADPRAGFLLQKEDLEKAALEVLNRGWYILGEQVGVFEEKFAAFLEARHAIGVANGTDAIELCLRTLDITAGSLVYTVSHTAVATVAAIERAGAIPVLVDVDPATYTMDPESLEAAIKKYGKQNSERRGAIVLVHLYGHPGDIESIQYIAKKYDLAFIEDCAQAHGARYRGRIVGTFGEMSAFSFYPTKNLGAFGDGGAVVTNNESLMQKARAMREYGWTQRYVSSYAGINSRLDEIQAAFLNVRLKRLNVENERRREIAARYSNALIETNVSAPIEHNGCTHVYHLYVVQDDARNNLQEYLRNAGIATAIHYPLPVHLQMGYKNRISQSPGNLPVTEKIKDRILSLPMYPQLNEESVSRIVDALQNRQH